MASAMTPKQRELLAQLIEVYTSQMTADVAAERQAEIKQGGLDKIAFAWAGPVTPGERHYYRVQGPTFVIEFDNTQNNGNHIHSVWRDFESDFVRDLLREPLPREALKTAGRGPAAPAAGPEAPRYKDLISPLL